jgi:glutathione S-transferase
MLVLYHHPMSAASRLVRLVLAEYDDTAEFVEEQPWARREAFLVLNPAATLPVMVDGDHPSMVGGVVICEFLDETRGVLKRERRLLPENPYERAEARRITQWALDKLENEVTRYLVNERVFKLSMPRDSGGGSPDSKVLRAARANLKYHIKYFGWLAATRNWLGGENITIADLAVASSLSVLDYLGEVPWDEDATLKEWYARIKSRPSFRPLLGDKVRGLQPASHYVDLDF